MANTIRVKRSSVQGKVPTTGDLQLGELAINTFDGKLYTKKDNGTPSVIEIGAAPSGAVTGSGLTMATARLLGRTAVGTGAIEEITVGTGLSLSGGTLSSTVATANAFSTIAVSGQSNVEADAVSDTLTLAAGTGVSITTNATTDTITVSTSYALSLAMS